MPQYTQKKLADMTIVECKQLFETAKSILSNNQHEINITNLNILWAYTSILHDLNFNILIKPTHSAQEYQNFHEKFESLEKQLEELKRESLRRVIGVIASQSTAASANSSSSHAAAAATVPTIINTNEKNSINLMKLNDLTKLFQQATEKLMIQNGMSDSSSVSGNSIGGKEELNILMKYARVWEYLDFCSLIVPPYSVQESKNALEKLETTEKELNEIQEKKRKLLAEIKIKFLDRPLAQPFLASERAVPVVKAEPAVKAAPAAINAFPLLSSNSQENQMDDDIDTATSSSATNASEQQEVGGTTTAENSLLTMILAMRPSSSAVATSAFSAAAASPAAAASVVHRHPNALDNTVEELESFDLEKRSTIISEARKIFEKYKNFQLFTRKAKIACDDVYKLWAGATLLYLDRNNIKDTGIDSKQEIFNWFELAAVQPYVPAVNNLGLCVLQGIGFKADPQMACQIFHNATEQDREYAPAWSNLGECYLNQVGTPHKNKSQIKKCIQRYIAIMGVKPDWAVDNIAPAAFSSSTNNAAAASSGASSSSSGQKRKKSDETLAQSKKQNVLGPSATLPNLLNHSTPARMEDVALPAAALTSAQPMLPYYNGVQSQINSGNKIAAAANQLAGGRPLNPIAIRIL